MTRPHSRTSPAEHERRDRRAALDVLLARAQRGRLSRAEAAALAQYVREEQRTADQSRKALTGTTRALERAREGADAAIRETEQHAEQAEKHLAGYVAIFGPNAVDDFHAMQHRAKTAEDQLTRRGERILAAEAALARVRALAHRMRAGSPQGAAAIYADRIEQALDDDPDGLTDEQAAVHAAFAEAADSTRARLAEQARGYEIQLAQERRTYAEWYRRALTADARADRLGAAWRSARRRAQARTRDAYANAEDFRAEREHAKQAEQQLAAVRAVLPTEPPPARGLPNDLAYANGAHDAYDAVRNALARP